MIITYSESFYFHEKAPLKLFGRVLNTSLQKQLFADVLQTLAICTWEQLEGL